MRANGRSTLAGYTEDGQLAAAARDGVAGNSGVRVSNSSGQTANKTQDTGAAVMNATAPVFGCATGGMPFEDALERVLRLVPARAWCMDPPVAAGTGPA
jgi:hypothetical protein